MKKIISLSDVSARTSTLILGETQSRTLISTDAGRAVLLPSNEHITAVDTYIKNRGMLHDPVDRMPKQRGDYVGEMVAHYATFGTESPAYKRMVAVGRTIEVVRTMPTARELDRLLLDYDYSQRRGQ